MTFEIMVLSLLLSLIPFPSSPHNSLLPGMDNINVEQVASLLAQTTSGSTVVQAQNELVALGSEPWYIPALMKVATMDGIDDALRLAAAIQFKTCIFNNWEPDEDGLNVIPHDIRDAIRRDIIALMVNSPPKPQLQYINAIGLMARSDFKAGQWDSLLFQLEEQLSDDMTRNLAVAETYHTIFYHFRDGPVPGALVELKHVTDTVYPSLTQLLQMAAQIITEPPNAAQLEVALKVFKTLMEVYYSLNFIDVCSFVQDHVSDWFQVCEAVVQLPESALKAKNDDEPTALDEAQSVVWEVLKLFTDRYEEVLSDSALQNQGLTQQEARLLEEKTGASEDSFESQLVASFVQHCFALLVSRGDESRFDGVITNALSFLNSLIRRPGYARLFKQEHVEQLCENVVIPQLKLRDSDEELFMSSGPEYVQADMLGSDVDTRRRIASDFVNSMCVPYEEFVTEVLKKHVTSLLAQYEQNKEENWKAKDAAMYIIVALSVRGSTRAEGATELNQYVDIGGFFESQVVTELSGGNPDDTPVIKADCIKFVAQFRSQLPPDSLADMIKLLIGYMGPTTHYVVHTYAAIAVDKILALMDPTTGEPRVPREAIATITPDVLGALFTLLAENDESTENEHVARAILRVCSVAKADIASHAETIIRFVSERLAAISKGAKNPVYMHNLFEILACLVSNLCTADVSAVDAFEEALIPTFEQMLGDSDSSFQPYVFQILAQLIEFRTNITEVHAGIFPSLLHSALWENSGNILALVRLLSAYFMRGIATTLTKDDVSGILGIFQRLHASPKTCDFALKLLTAVYVDLPLELTVEFLPQVHRFIFERLQKSAKPEYKETLILFWSQFVLVHGPQVWLENLAKVQATIANMVLKMWARCLDVFTNIQTKKVCYYAWWFLP